MAHAVSLLPNGMCRASRFKPRPRPRLGRPPSQSRDGNTARAARWPPRWATTPQLALRRIMMAGRPAGSTQLSWHGTLGAARRMLGRGDGTKAVLGFFLGSASRLESRLGPVGCFRGLLTKCDLCRSCDVLLQVEGIRLSDMDSSPRSYISKVQVEGTFLLRARDATVKTTPQLQHGQHTVGPGMQLLEISTEIASRHRRSRRMHGQVMSCHLMSDVMPCSGRLGGIGGNSPRGQFRRYCKH